MPSTPQQLKLHPFARWGAVRHTRSRFASGPLKHSGRCTRARAMEGTVSRWRGCLAFASRLVSRPSARSALATGCCGSGIRTHSTSGTWRWTHATRVEPAGGRGGAVRAAPPSAARPAGSAPSRFVCTNVSGIVIASPKVRSTRNDQPAALRAVRTSRKLGPFFIQGLAVFTSLVGPLAVRHQRPLSRVQKRTGKQSHMDHITAEAGTAQGAAKENVHCRLAMEFLVPSWVIELASSLRACCRFRRWNMEEEDKAGPARSVGGTTFRWERAVLTNGEGSRPSAPLAQDATVSSPLPDVEVSPVTHPSRARLLNSLNVCNARERTELAERFPACTGQRNLRRSVGATHASTRVEHRCVDRGVKRRSEIDPLESAASTFHIHTTPRRRSGRSRCKSSEIYAASEDRVRPLEPSDPAC